MQVLFRVAEEGDHPVVHDLDELLARIDGAEDFLALRLLDGRVDEAAHDAEIYVGFEEGHLDFFDGILDVLFGYARLSAYLADDVAEGVRYFFEHDQISTPSSSCSMNSWGPSSLLRRR